MNISESFDQESLPYLVTDVSYDVEEDGHMLDTPIIYLRLRGPNGESRIVEVEGFRPHLGVRMSDCMDHLESICNDRRTIGLELDCRPSVWGERIGLAEDEYDDYTPNQVAHHLSTQTGTDIYHREPYQTIDGEDVAFVYARTPGDIGGSNSLRSSLPFEPLEADILFENRFCIDVGIKRGVKIPTGTRRVRYENWPGEPEITGRFKPSQGSSAETPDRPSSREMATLVQDVEPCEPPDVQARTIIYDIEVSTEGIGFPDVSQANVPITAITAYDSYENAYSFWGLAHDDWDVDIETVESHLRERCANGDLSPNPIDEEPSCSPKSEFEIGSQPIADIEIYSDETDMLYEFNEWVLDRQPDIFTGWNAGGTSGGFDTPYLIQRSYNVQARNICNYALHSNPGTWSVDGDEHDFAMQGRSTLDLLDAYQKTQYRELDSYKLDDVAEAELGVGKTGMEHDELDHYWEHDPVKFFVYNIRDTQVTAGVEAQSGLIELFENLRSVTGAQYETAINNGPMLDMLFLGRAADKGYVLPTNTEPEEDVYHGAKVFETKPGRHQNAVYPDLSSLYPNLFWMLNLGSETIIEDIESSSYTRDECFRVPIDNRDFAIVPKGESIDGIDRDAYKGVKTPSGGTREMFEPEYQDMWVLKPDVKESFVRDTIDDLIELKNNYTGSMYAAVKRVTNSCYGVLGDSASAGVGFRLYDRRVAEAITLAGRQVITHTADEFTSHLQDNYDPDAELIGGDTDAAVSTVPNADTLQEAWEWANSGVEHVDDTYDDFVVDAFDFDADDKHRLHVELESLASTLFFLGGDESTTYVENESGMLVSKTSQSSVKKRYAQHVVWDDDDGWIDPDVMDVERVTYETYEDELSEYDASDNISIKGFEYVRSDSAPITKQVQLRVLTDILLADDPRDRIEPYVTDVVDTIKSGDVPISELAQPKGVGQHLDEYGWKDIDDLTDIDDMARAYGGRWIQTPGPTYRGAKYADDHFEWEQIHDADKVSKVPIERVRSDAYPEVYSYESYPEEDRPPSPEVGQPVDALAVEQPERIPDGFVIDYDTIVQKTIEEKVEDILNTMDITWSDMMGTGTQATLGSF
jgi:DNA polymerase I